jgi:N-acetyl-alpha-D-muramate 1-phosphate uridylyltransferase
VSSGARPDVAMVLAAGLGKRMRPLTDTMPKPLVKIAGKTLLDWGLDSIAEAGVSRAVVNVHYFPEQITAHVSTRRKPRVAISDESSGLLDSGGGIVHALPLLGTAPFFTINADTFWIDRSVSNLDRLALAWDPSRMDILLMLADFESATGHTGNSDFLLAVDGTLKRSAGAPAGLIYAGAAILHPRIFDAAPAGRHSLNIHFDRAIAAGRLHGMKMDGHWITVGTPDAVPLAEAAVADALAEG